MTLHIFSFFLGILVPYFAEQVAYAKLIPTARAEKKISQGYGWRFIWDTAYFLTLISAGYRIIFQNIPLSVWEWLAYGGFLFGIFIRIWALKELGKYYDPGIALRDDHQLVHSGIYRFLRHPLHLGTVLQISGLAGFTPLWLRLPAVLASVWLCLYLNRTEDKIHLTQFGADFQPYYLKTWDLIDLIYWKKH